MTIDLRDPAGFTHRLELLAGTWHGSENIAHIVERKDQKRLREVVLARLEEGRPLPAGYTAEVVAGKSKQRGAKSAVISTH